MAKEARSLGWALDGGRSDDQGSPARPASYRAGSVRTALGAVSVCPWPKHGCVGPRLNQGDSPGLPGALVHPTAYPDRIRLASSRREVTPSFR